MYLMISFKPSKARLPASPLKCDFNFHIRFLSNSFEIYKSSFLNPSLRYRIARNHAVLIASGCTHCNKFISLPHEPTQGKTIHESTIAIEMPTTFGGSVHPLNINWPSLVFHNNLNCQRAAAHRVLSI